MEAESHVSGAGRCVLCGRTGPLERVRRGRLAAPLTPEHLRITDFHYGTTADIFRCPSCGMLQCATLPDPLPCYQALEDPEYERGRPARALQMRHILRVIREYRPAGRLLDVGAASGILVEEALKMGYSAEGVEPSRVFCEEARTRGLPVHPGTLPQTGVRGPFDVITLIDVIEHVPDPVRLLRETRPLLADGGIGVAVTPDAGSLAARLMGSRWWHYRVAHLCYFTRRTLGMALDAAGLLPLHFQRAGWVFPADYLWERLGRYLPPRLRMRPWPIMSRVAVRLNLLDSFLVVYQKK